MICCNCFEPNLADAQRMIQNGRFNYTCNDRDAALRHFQDALQIEERLAPKSLDRAVCCKFIGKLYADRQQYREAKNMYQTSIDILMNLAGDYRSIGEKNDILKKLTVENALELKDVFICSAAACQSLGEKAEALEMTKEADSIREIIQKAHPSVCLYI